jgi:SAM-dependent methyltransferase
MLILVGAAVAVALVRRGHGAARGHSESGGILIRNAAAYDVFSRLVLGSFFEGVASDAAATAPHGGQVLEVGCEPGHLSMRLARRHCLDVTGLDLDPAMIERASANDEHTTVDGSPRLTFQVSDVASLPYLDDSFDVVVSTLSMHHWADPTAGLRQIARVLRPGGRALIWDFRPGVWPFHPGVPNPIHHRDSSPLRVVNAAPWPWPWRLKLTRRLELADEDDSPTAPLEHPNAK